MREGPSRGRPPATGLDPPACVRAGRQADREPVSSNAVNYGEEKKENKKSEQQAEGRLRARVSSQQEAGAC